TSFDLARSCSAFYSLLYPPSPPELYTLSLHDALPISLTRLATDQPSARSRFTTTPRCVVRAKWGLLSHTPTSPTVFHSRSLNTTRSLGRGRGPSIGANTCTPRMIGPRFASNGSDSPAWPRGATP